MTVALRGTIPAHLWALAGLGMLLGAFAVRSAAIRAVAASPTMRIVSVGRGPSVLVVASRTGRVFVGNHDDATVSVLDAASGAVLGTIALGHYPLAATVDERHGRVVFLNTDDRDNVSSAGSPGSVSVLDARSGALLHTALVGHGPEAVAVDADSGHVFVANSGDGTVSVLDGMSGSLLRAVGVAGIPRAVAIDERTGRAFVAVDGDGFGAVNVLDTRRGTLLRMVRLGASATDAVVSSGTGRIFVATDYGLALLDARSGVVRRTIGGTAVPLLADERSGRVLAMASAGLELLDAWTGIPRGHPVPWRALGGLGRGSPVAAVDAVSGQIVVVTIPTVALGRDGGGGRVDVLDGRTGALLRSIAVGPQPNAVAVDGRTHHVFVSDHGVAPGPDRVQILLDRLRRWLPWLSPLPAPRIASGSVSVLLRAGAPKQTASNDAPGSTCAGMPLGTRAGGQVVDAQTKKTSPACRSPSPRSRSCWGAKPAYESTLTGVMPSMVVAQNRLP